MDRKFLGICIIIASIIVSGTLIFTNRQSRYKVVGEKVFDTFAGEFVEQPEEPIETELNYTDDEAKALIDLQRAGQKLGPKQQRIVNDYINKTWVVWAEEYSKDVKLGKVQDVSLGDKEYILQGKKPVGRYKNPNDTPEWFDELRNH